MRDLNRIMCSCAVVTLVLGGLAVVAHGQDKLNERGSVDGTVSFDLDVQPIFAAQGCSAGACHGKQNGQNGFALSLLGFDSDFDYAAVTKEGRGRRVFPGAPDQSLLLLKATAAVPHGGGKRIAPGSEDYRTIRKWIEQGMPRRAPNEPTLQRVTVTPNERFMKPGDTQQLKVTAHYSDGSTRDVTARSSFQSNEAAVVAVSDDGLIKAGPIPGEAAIMARYSGRIVTCSVAIPLQGGVPDALYAQLPRNNFIDDHVWAKLKSLGITPSPPIDDAKFLRRVHQDIIGRLPTADETRAFLADKRPDKRARLVDALLGRPEYADFWANKWADLLLPNPYRVGIKATMTYDNWIRQSFRDNKPHDQFVRELVTARGSTWRNGATVLFRDRRSPDEIGTMVSQLFLGIRLECAKCHQHPFEKWGQDDFYSFAAYFSKIARKGRGLSPPISGSEEMIYTATKGEVRHPRTDEVLPPRPLFGDTPKVEAEQDLRDALADWITSDNNDAFAMVAANRIWADLMGRGLVDPIDDFRATNPATNEPLLRALAEHFRKYRYDNKALIRAIVLSRAYSLSSIPTERNAADTRNYSRHYRQRMRAEVLLDAIDDVTGVPTSFSAMPAGSRATQLWTRRIDSVFLDTFGRPNENENPPCERTPDSTVTQALHLMNSPRVFGKVTSDKGLAARLAKSDATTTAIIQTLYLTVYNRYPTADERAYTESLYQGDSVDRRRATEGLLWAMLNTPEFLFKD